MRYTGTLDALRWEGGVHHSHHCALAHFHFAFFLLFSFLFRGCATLSLPFTTPTDTKEATALMPQTCGSMWAEAVVK
jgi:hypothetical protein